MEVNYVVFDPNTFGITQRSLKLLRDSLAEKINHRIVVVEVPTNDLCCGYLIFDRELQNATWTGDGFRTDGGGEGGAGYKSARTLFRFFGIWPISWEEVSIDEIYGQSLEEDQIGQQLKLLAREIADALGDESFFKPSERNPEYVR